MKKSKYTQANKHNKTEYLLQDIALFFFLATIFLGIVMTVFAPAVLRIEFIIMLLITFMGILLAAYRFPSLSVICGGLQIIIFASYKLFSYFVYGRPIHSLEYVWLIYPLIAIGSMVLYIYRSFRMEILNKTLRRHIDELVLVDPLTGLYNLKCLYLDLETQVALAARKKSEIVLMIITLRYAKELIKILGKNNFDILKQQVAYIVQDCLRIEDKPYAIGEDGELAVILTTNEEGSHIVKNRIKKALTDKDRMPEIIRNRVVRLDIRIAALEYNVERFDGNVMRYKEVVESELQYDV